MLSIRHIIYGPNKEVLENEVLTGQYETFEELNRAMEAMSERYDHHGFDGWDSFYWGRNDSEPQRRHAWMYAVKDGLPVHA